MTALESFYLISKKQIALNPKENRIWFGRYLRDGLYKKHMLADVVLLFETKAGWNQFGGPELLTTEHHEGKGCNVLFNDGDVEFIKKEQVGELKWKVDKGDSNEI